jgi:glycosyltransferase involved in cell wall biosynthesis
MRDAIAAEFAQKPDGCIAMELASAPLIPFDRNGVPVLLEQVEVTGVARAVTSTKDVKAKWQAVLTRAKHDRYWRRELRRFDALTAVSEEEAAAVRILLGSRKPPVIVVPNGVDVEYYSPKGVAPIPGRIVYNDPCLTGRTGKPSRGSLTKSCHES